MRRRRLLRLLLPALAGLGGCAAIGLLSGCATNRAIASGDPAAATTMDENADTLPVRLSAEAPRSAYTAALEVRVEARNGSDVPLDLLLWNTPFETVLSADLFEIVREGDDEPLAYRGRVVKRALPPPTEAIITLAPGERIESVVDLSRHYALDRPGRYAITLKPLAVPLDADGHDLVATSVADPEPLLVERF